MSKKHHRRHVHTGWPALVLALCGAWCLVLTAIDDQQWPREIPPLEITRSGDAPRPSLPDTAPDARDARTDPADADRPVTIPVPAPPSVPPNRPGVQTDGLMSQALGSHHDDPSPAARAFRQADTLRAGSSEQRSGMFPARDDNDGPDSLPVGRGRDLPHQGAARQDPWWWGGDDDRFAISTDQLDALLLEALQVGLDSDPTGCDTDPYDVDDWDHPDNETPVTLDVPLPDQPPADGAADPTEWAGIPEFSGEDTVSETSGDWVMDWATGPDGTDCSDARPAQITTDPFLAGRPETPYAATATPQNPGGRP